MKNVLRLITLACLVGSVAYDANAADGAPAGAGGGGSGAGAPLGKGTKRGLGDDRIDLLPQASGLAPAADDALAAPEADKTGGGGSGAAKPKKYYCIYDRCTFSTDIDEKMPAHAWEHVTKMPPMATQDCGGRSGAGAALGGGTKRGLGSDGIDLPLHATALAPAADDATVQERTAGGKKHFICRFCAYSSTIKENLNRHERTHTGQKPFTCAYCGYTARRSDTLKTHELIHTGEKPFECRSCAYRAATSSQIRIHERTHTGEKPYGCTVCDYRATTSSSLTRHMHTHTPGDGGASAGPADQNPLQCLLCGYIAPRNRALTAHMRTAHPTGGESAEAPEEGEGTGPGGAPGATDTV